MSKHDEEVVRAISSAAGKAIREAVDQLRAEFDQRVKEIQEQALVNIAEIARKASEQASSSVERFVDQPEFLSRVRGQDGVDGKDGVDGLGIHEIKLISPNTLAFRLTDGGVETVEIPVIKGDQGEKGEKGDQGDRGEKGDAGKDGDSVTLSEVVTGLLSSKDFRDATTPVSIASIEQEDGAREFVVKLTDGTECSVELPEPLKGDPGHDGKDGTSVTVEEAISALLSSKEFISASRGVSVLRIEQGEDRKSFTIMLDDESSHVIHLPDPIKGDQGEPGKDGVSVKGEPGEGINSPVWAPGIYREHSIVTAHLGRYYRAIKDTVSVPGESEDWERLGTAGFRLCGVKDPDKQYEEGDIYIDNGTSFLFTGGKGRMLAKRGTDGKDGRDGKDGINGVGIKDVVVDGAAFVMMMDDGGTFAVDMAPHIDKRLEDALSVMRAHLAEEIDRIAKLTSLSGRSAA